MTISIKANAAGTQGEVLLNGTPVQTFNQNTLQVSGNVLAGAAQSADPAALTRRDYVDGLADVLLRVSNTAGQALPANSSTTLLYPTTEVNVGAGWNAATGEYTVQKTGLYMISTITRIAYGSVGGELSGGGLATGAGVKQSGGRFIDVVDANKTLWPAVNIVAWCPAGSIIKTTWYCEYAASVSVAASQNTNMTISRLG